MIETLESRQGELEQVMSNADFYQREHTEVQSVLDEVAKVQAELETALERWTELED